jgi:hypothetical protein
MHPTNEFQSAFLMRALSIPLQPNNITMFYSADGGADVLSAAFFLLRAALFAALFSFLAFLAALSPLDFLFDGVTGTGAVVLSSCPAVAADGAGVVCAKARAGVSVVAKSKEAMARYFFIE